MEFVPNGFSKASGIKKTCEFLNIPLENTFAFGDSVNDLDMLSYVAHGVAMGNGTDDAKQAAEYVTSSLHEDGIMRGLEYYGLI
jgi:hydroxymethylpyrimidine pyrophosphatase-like HAD family hydrolase